MYPNNKKKWSDEEKDILVKNYSEMGKKWCSNKLGRTTGSIGNQTMKMGLKLNRKSKYILSLWIDASKKRIGSKRTLETRKKMSDKLKGDKCYAWQGGITDLNAQKRQTFDYREFRKNVFERDGYKCVVCDSVGGKIRCHHIENFSSNEEIQTNINNGITMCKECHSDFHLEYGKYNNSMEQLCEFILDNN